MVPQSPCVGQLFIADVADMMRLCSVTFHVLLVAHLEESGKEDEQGVDRGSLGERRAE